MKKDNHYFAWGLTAVGVACTVLLFYDLVFRSSIILEYLGVVFAVLSPILLGCAMAYLLAPVVNWFERVVFRRRKRAKWARTASVTLTWLVVLGLLYALVSILAPELYKSLVRLADNAQRYYNTIYAWVLHYLENNPAFLEWANDLVGQYYDPNMDFSTWVSSMVNAYYADALTWINSNLIPSLKTAVQAVGGGVMGFLVFFKNLLLGVVVSVYLLAGKEGFAAGSCKLCYTLLPEERASWMIRGVKAVDRIFSGFVRGKLLDSLIIGILCFFFSSIFDFPYAPLVSVVVGVTNIIPFFGPFLGAIPSAFLILLDSPIKCLYFIVFILALQQFDGNILGPRILGDSTGISGFWVMVAILVGGGLWGVAGMFLGVPVFACFYTGVRSFAAYRLTKKGLPVPAESYAGGRPVWPEDEEAVEEQKP